MSRPNIEGTRYLMGPGPREPHGLHRACPAPCSFGALQPPPPSSLGKQPGDWHPLSWPQPTWGHVPTSPGTAGGWLRGVGTEFEPGRERGDTSPSPFTSVPSHRALNTRRPRGTTPALGSLTSPGDQDHKAGVGETRKPGQTPINCWTNRTANK